MGLTRLAIARPVAILMLVGAFLVLGLFSFFHLPAELNPQVDFPTVTVTTTYAGTDPQEMETLITRPIENSISGVSGIQEIDSTSQQGISRVAIQFYFGTNLDTADSDVTQKVDGIRRILPIQATSPSVQKADTSSQPVLRLTMESDKISPRDLRTIADNQVLPALEEGTDVGGVNDFGGDVREIQVSVSAAKLAAYGITVSQLANAINNANVNVSTGFIQHAQNYYNVRFIGEFASVDEIKNLRLTINPSGGGSGGTTGVLTASPGGSSGGSGSSSSSSSPQSFNLSDVATIEDSVQEQTINSFVNGGRGVSIVVQKTSDGNTLTAVQSALDHLNQLKKFLPPGITFLITQNEATNVQENLSDVVVSLMLGAIMAVLVVYLFLHNVLGTIIVGIALPTSMIATFLPLFAFGFTLNTMTLMGLSLAVGILVDDSIVVLENINRHLALGEEPVEAAINGRTEIGLAAVTLTAVDLVVFLPIAFMGGVIGEFFRSFGITVAIATMFSLFISFTMTPMLAARWYRKGQRMEFDTGFAGAFDRGFKRFEGFYQRFLRASLRHPWVVLAVGNIFLIVIFFLLLPVVGFRFAPNQDQNQVSVSVKGPPGASLTYTQGITDQIERIIRSTPDLNYDVEFISTTIGRSATGGPGSGVAGTQYGSISLTLYDRKSVLDNLLFWRHEHLRNRSDVDVALELRKLTRNIPGAIILASNVSGFGGGGAPFEVDLTGPDLSQLLAATEQVQKMVRTLPGTYNIDTSYSASQPEVQIRLDRVKAADYGLDVNAVAQAIADAIGGNIVAQYRDPITGQQYNINVQLANYDRNAPQDVGAVVVGYQNAVPIHVSDVANVTVGAGPVQLQRLNRQEEVAVTAYLLPGYQVGNVGQAAGAKLAKMDLGQVAYSMGGENKSIAQEGGYLVVALVLGIVLTYMLMAALFNNVVYPFSIMLSLPQAWAGALIALWIAQEPLSLIAMIGVVLLNGIVNKNAILLVDYTNTLRRRGYKRIDALLEAGPTRLRPIMMTSIAILVTSLPTALALGRGAGFRQSLGVAVLGGVSLSLVLSLIVVPCAYLLFDNLTNFISRIVWHRSIPTTDQVALTRERPTWGDGSDGHEPGYPPALDEKPGDLAALGAGRDRRLDSDGQGPDANGHAAGRANGHTQSGNGHGIVSDSGHSLTAQETEPEEDVVED